MRYYKIFFVILIICNASLAQSADALEVYDTITLQKANQTYAENLRFVWKENLLGRLTDNERQAAGGVKLNIPLVGSNGSPFGYYAAVNAREVTIPIMSVKFFDDLSTAEAWLISRKCAMNPVSDYVGILRYQGLPNSHGQRNTQPLQALSIPDNALKDEFVNDVSGKTLKSAIYFLMAHELAHVIYQHKPYNMISRPEAQAQEMQADDFALNVMRRISVPPMGMVLFFTLCSRFEPAPGDFDSLEAYENFVKKMTTHPLTSQRLIALSKGMRSRAADFSQGQKNPAAWKTRIIKAADDIEKIADTLDDRRIRELQKYRSETVKMSDLSNTCRSNNK